MVQRNFEAGPSILAWFQQRKPNTSNAHAHIRDHDRGEAYIPLARAKGTLQFGRHSSSGPLSTRSSDPAPPPPPDLSLNDGESKMKPLPSRLQGEFRVGSPREDRAVIHSTQGHVFTHPVGGQEKSVASTSKNPASNVHHDIVQGYQVHVSTPIPTSDYFIIHNIVRNILQHTISS